MAETNSMSPHGAVDERGGAALAHSADLQRLLAYWHEIRGDRRFPQRANLDPIDLRFMLDRIALVAVHEEGCRRYRLRVVGSWWAQKYGFEATGTWLEDWPNPVQLRATLASYEALMALRQPVILVRNELADGAVLNYEAALLPFSEDDERISAIVAGIGQH
ncbi:PAS domain-containing protein [Dongia sp.]|uniref:PAS domain-containing protein n=1 Tax=Dongia sp. TaxID=1977262 RepID=UPI0035B1E073